MGRLPPQFLTADDSPERGMPDMAFTSSAFPEPQDQPASDRFLFINCTQTYEDPKRVASVHPSTQHLHDTGFGPIAEVGDEPMRSEWRLWVVLAGLCALWFLLMVWIAEKFRSIIDWVSSLA
jgi:hypothetical protein